MNKEYEWLLNFYLQIIAFDIVTSIFQKLKNEDRELLLQDINSLKEKLEKILPVVQEAQ